VLIAMALLGRPLGAALLPTPELRFFGDVLRGVRPEPTEQARFLIALTAPLVHLALTLLLLRRSPTTIAASAGTLARAAEAVTIGAIAVFFVVQRTTDTEAGLAAGRPVVFFTIATVVVAATIAAALTAAIRSPAVRERFGRWAAESRARRAGALLIAVAAIAITLLPGIETDGTIDNAYGAVSFHLEFTYDETMAVLNGRSPMGDFAAQYASLWPYLVAGGLSLLGASLAAVTGIMTLLNGVVLLALFDVLRRVARSSIAALLLFLPLLATSAFRLQGPEVNRFSLVNFFAVLPLRYAGPLLLAWLVARQLDGARPRRAWPLFVIGGLVVLNNPDFGIAAVGATVAALLWTWRRGDTPLRQLALEAALGLAAAVGLVTALLLVRTGSPPDFSLLFRYAEVFVRGGFAMLPIQPIVGLSTIIFLTHAIAIGIAGVRALRGDPDRLLTGMLVWSGVFGLGSGAYYVGHSLPELVTYLFPTWGLTLTLLTVLAIRGLASRSTWRPTLSEAACLFGFGLLVCSLAQTPAPWSELRRLEAEGARNFEQLVGQEFVAEETRPGEPVIIFTTLGHRMAETIGVENVERYTGSRSVQTREQLEESLDALRAAGGNKMFVWVNNTYTATLRTIDRTFRVASVEPRGMALVVRR
jgi:hypothetical protein